MKGTDAVQVAQVAALDGARRLCLRTACCGSVVDMWFRKLVGGSGVEPLPQGNDHLPMNASTSILLSAKHSQDVSGEELGSLPIHQSD